MPKPRRKPSQKKKHQGPSLEERLSKYDCICCHCEAIFSPIELAGSYLDRRCPVCGERLFEDAYDAAHEDIAKSLEKLKTSSSELCNDIRKLDERLARLKFPLLVLPRVILKRKRKKITAEASSITEEIVSLKHRSALLALSRYYTGEWFQRTHTLLKRKGSFHYSFDVYYDEKGDWNLKPKNKLASGIAAEFKVFQQLLRRVQFPDSPLFQAQIIPNIYLPIMKRTDYQAPWTQIDCVLMTKFGAFVLEVKKRSCNIISLAPFEDIWSTGDQMLAKSIAEKSGSTALPLRQLTNETSALRQNSQHAVAFDEMCDLYPFERIYEQVVYFEPKSFQTNLRSFVDNVNVSCLGECDISFDRIIENQCRSLKCLLEQEELDEAAEDMLAKYGDLNQLRGELHAQSISSRCA